MTGFNRIYNWVVNGLSFSPGLLRMRQILNAGIDRPESIEHYPESHPRGFVKQFRKRRLSIVESYVKIIGFLESSKYNERLTALKLLAPRVLYSRSLSMPLNTARVQLALMKSAVKNRDNKRTQLERLRDFSISSFGNPKQIRKYLNQLGIIEVPETGQPLRELNMGCDSHVHDNASYGRKNPTQLIIDAFIKGISGLTVVYNTLGHPEIIREAVEAGSILGIDVRIGLEFHVGRNGKRFHYIYLPPPLDGDGKIETGLEALKDRLGTFVNGLEESRKNRITTINDTLDYFNRTHLPVLNRGYRPGTIYYLDHLTLKDFKEIIPLKHATRMHLGELLYNKYRPVLFNRVLRLKSLEKRAGSQCRERQNARWEHKGILEKYTAVREEYRWLEPETLRLKYFEEPHGDFRLPPVLTDLRGVFSSGDRGRIKLIHPLQHGPEAAVACILDNYRYIGSAEIYNMHDSILLNHDELKLFASFLDLLNRGRLEPLQRFLDRHGIDAPREILIQCTAFCAENPIIPAYGSDSTGRTSYIPGMGFISRKALVKTQHPGYLKNHYFLPTYVSRLVTRYGGGPGGAIVSMGKSKKVPPNEIGDEDAAGPIPPRRAWRYLHPALKNLFYITAGYIPAYLTVGRDYALLWFAVTLVRNAVTDIISGRGYRPREWHVKNIDFDNLSHSLFWTGFSVPLLGYVKKGFDGLYPLAAMGLLFEFTRFFVICMANGIYLATHNTLRGFEKTIVRANFFRGVAAWPFAAIFAPIGNLMGVPAIVQAKFWSDFVAGLVEGAGKFNRRINLRKRDLGKLLPNITSGENHAAYIAALDLLYFFRQDPRARNSLKFILLKTPSPRDYSEYDRLKKWFDDDGHFFRLLDFVLDNYNDPAAIYLADLLSETYDPFRQWLKRNAPRGVDASGGPPGARGKLPLDRH